MAKCPLRVIIDVWHPHSIGLLHVQARTRLVARETGEMGQKGDERINPGEETHGAPNRVQRAQARMFIRVGHKCASKAGWAQC